MTDGTYRYDLVDRTVERIVGLFSPETIIVHGPVAKGVADEHSDLNLLVVMDTDLPFFRRPPVLYRELRGIGLSMDIRVMTPDEFDYVKDDPNTYTHMIVRTGRVVYRRGM
ncbi:MAG: nucleotidyltransferase domain-containing protein [Candidatus Methanomethylophilaceae archaeon]|nr:nucleotidyltransferase domain-containing protein [Candidatus Methanomethylophilaceae archaeon]